MIKYIRPDYESPKTFALICPDCLSERDVFLTHSEAEKQKCKECTANMNIIPKNIHIGRGYFSEYYDENFKTYVSNKHSHQEMLKRNGLELIGDKEAIGEIQKKRKAYDKKKKLETAKKEVSKIRPYLEQEVAQM